MNDRADEDAKIWDNAEKLAVEKYKYYTVEFRRQGDWVLWKTHEEVFDGEPVADGHVQQDGCSEWYFGQHCCTFDDVQILSGLILWISKKVSTEFMTDIEW